MMNLLVNKKEYTKLYEELQQKNITLVAVSKTHPIEAIQVLYDMGHRDFGESKVQELVKKAAKLPQDIRWHQIGPLQSNKIKEVLPYASMIQSGTRMKVFRYVEKYASKNEKIIDMLIQVHIAKEDTKSGFTYNKLESLLENAAFDAFPHVRIRGLMGIATLTREEAQIRNEFTELRHKFDEIRNTYFSDSTYFDTVSMGMSGDYQIAINSGSTLVRIGSLIFGKRDYGK